MTRWSIGGFGFGFGFGFRFFGFFLASAAAAVQKEPPTKANPALPAPQERPTGKRVVCHHCVLQACSSLLTRDDALHRCQCAVTLLFAAFAPLPGGSSS